MGFWAAAAPALISAGASILGGLMSKKPKQDPRVSQRLDLENALLRSKQGYLNQLDQYLGRGTLLGSDGKPLTMHLGKDWPKSLAEFMQAADFGAKRDQGLLESLIQMSTPGGNTAGPVQSGQLAASQASERTATALSKMLSDVGQQAWQEYGVGSKDLAKKLDKIDMGDVWESAGVAPGVDIAALNERAGGSD